MYERKNWQYDHGMTTEIIADKRNTEEQVALYAITRLSDLSHIRDLIIEHLDPPSYDVEIEKKGYTGSGEDELAIKYTVKVSVYF